MAKLPSIYNEKSIRKSAQALKLHFLDNAQPLIDEYIGAALGTGKLNSNNSTAREEVWGVLKQLMLQSSDKLELEITNADDILIAVSNGKCTMEEGKQLLDLYKKAKEISTMGTIAGIGKDAGLTINILSAPTKEICPPSVGPPLNEIGKSLRPIIEKIKNEEKKVLN